MSVRSTAVPAVRKCSAEKCRHISFRKVLLSHRSSHRLSSLFPLKTREIADGCNMSVYAARYYLQELSKLYLVESERSGRGKSIRWYLHK
ncbi:hypothetical protein GP721_22815 [Enterobacteriaceae bacterium TzEc077]|nr:hypothetical protein GP720_22625 [Escherichia coli]KAE9700136.1 hypothetical protein GP721_22815 [Enterobacteriaceae bacterium TzEc077]HAV9304580.1 hypothetical protein [Escherichia coli]